jgi:hypothetical protein
MGNGADLATARDEKVRCAVSDQDATIHEIGIRSKT